LNGGIRIPVQVELKGGAAESDQSNSFDDTQEYVFDGDYECGSRIQLIATVREPPYDHGSVECSMIMISTDGRIYTDGTVMVSGDVEVTFQCINPPTRMPTPCPSEAPVKTDSPTMPPTLGPTINDVDCVTRQAVASDCTSSCGSVTISEVLIAQSGNGAACVDTTYTCQPGDGHCPPDVDCVIRQAVASDCTSSCGYVTVSDVVIAQSGNGAACVDTTYTCQPGDGQCPDCVDLAEGSLVHNPSNHYLYIYLEGTKRHVAHCDMCGKNYCLTDSWSANDECVESYPSGPAFSCADVTCGSNGNNYGTVFKQVTAHNSCSCAVLCEAEDECAAWTYIPNGILGSSNDCVLRSTFGAMIDNCGGLCLSAERIGSN